MDARRLGFFLAGDLVAAIAAGALILADRVVAGILVGVLIVLVVSALGLRGLRR